MQLIWNFKADEYDIGFQVELDGKQSIIDYSRVDAHKYLQKGLIACNTMGKCEFAINYCFILTSIFKYLSLQNNAVTTYCFTF